MPEKSPPSNSATSDAGLLVLGMHRCGTSVLARILEAAGAHPGSRLVGASAGNEDGHWEDAFAVETHERLLHRLGRTWNDLRELPHRWWETEAAQEALLAISAHLREGASRHRIWAIKDPRMCIFARLWVTAASSLPSPVSVVLMARHPTEVARSLAERDGMSVPAAELLWLRHVLEAERTTRDLPRCFVTYAELLSDAAGVLERIRRMPGAAALKGPDELGPAFAAIVNPGKRHHEATEKALRGPIALAWQAQLSAVSGEVKAARGQFDSAAEELQRAETLFSGVVDEIERERDLLWRRTAFAEAALSGRSNELLQVPGRIEQLQEGVDRSAHQILEVLSGDIRRMQEAHARALETVATLESQAGLGRDVAPRIGQLAEGVDALRSQLLEAVGDEIRRMQQAHVDAVQVASSLQGEAGLGRELSPRIIQLSEGVDSLRTGVIEAVSNEIRRMQEAYARAVESEASCRSQADLASAMAPALEKLADQQTSLTQALERERDEIRGLQARLAEETDRSASLSDALDAGRQRTDELTGQRDQLQQHVADLEHALALGRSRLQVLEGDSRLLEAVRRSWSWRLTRPLRLAVRVLRQRGFTDHERKRLREWWALQLAHTRFLPAGFRKRQLMRAGSVQAIASSRPRDMEIGRTSPSPKIVTPAPALPGKADVYVWSVIDWHFRIQRPQHLARGMAEAGHRVFYVSNNFIDSEEPGIRVEALDESGRLFQVNLHVPGAPPIYYATPDEEIVACIRRSTAELMNWADSHGGIGVVQHPFWFEVAASMPASRLLYDCMDHHAGFEDNSSDILAAEKQLTRSADLLIVTSEWLDKELENDNPNRALVRNACEYDHFCEHPGAVFEDSQGRPIIGYYGAIAQWFDVELVRKVARANPDCLVLMVGNDTVEAARQLSDEANVLFTGEVPYDELPYYLYAFDVALLPFQVIPLTLATNPVKVYEYLSAGVPVVSVDLPEIAQFGDLVARATGHDAFIAEVKRMLGEPGNEAVVEARRQFARNQTWSHRALELDAAIAGLREPKVSVIVLTYNNWAFTKACLHSLVEFTEWPNLEIIVVDNASTDGTPERLREWEQGGLGRRVILNDENLGFSAGNNVGLAAAKGDYLVLLNNDTYVTPGWLRTLVRHLARNPDIGIIGPVTNNIGNEARIEIDYADMHEMVHYASRYTRKHMGHLFDLRTVAFFCVGMSRKTYEAVGPMDEDFGVGFFEDDDYCRRVEQLGLRVVCADDVFVHHHLSASFDALKADRKKELFERNKAIYEAKWGPWEPHVYRGSAQ